MKKLSIYFTFALLFALSYFPSLHAQTATCAPAGASAKTESSAPGDQAPDEMTRKITDLVHTGKYAEAQKLTEGLLIAYPNDQRLLKARALIEKMIASAGSTSVAPVTSQPAQPGANAEQLTGMDKVDYNALIVLARQSQQTTDLDEQKKLLQQFMEQSVPFLQKHADVLLLWQLRAASAISLNEPMEGYEAGQKLLAAGAVDSSDPALQQLLAQLKNKGWLDKQSAEHSAKLALVPEADRDACSIKMGHDWLLGDWTAHYTAADQFGGGVLSLDGIMVFVQNNNTIEGYFPSKDTGKDGHPSLYFFIIDSDVYGHGLSCDMSDNNTTLRVVFVLPNGSKGLQTSTWLLRKQ